MNPGYRNSRSAGLFQSALVSALLLIPLVSQAQVFFGAGGLTNNDTSANVTNMAFGYQTLYTNTTGDFNTADGYAALFNNVTGIRNTANRTSALYSNVTGNYNLTFRLPSPPS